jgi:hypothetical protein
MDRRISQWSRLEIIKAFVKEVVMGIERTGIIFIAE